MPSSLTIRRQPRSSSMMAASSRISYRGSLVDQHVPSVAWFASVDEFLQRVLEAGVAGLAHLERQPEYPSRALGRDAQLGRRLLREPDDLLVVAEVVVAQLGVAVEPETAHDDAVEAADEEVGEEVRRRLVLGAIDLVAVRAFEPGEAR